MTLVGNTNVNSILSRNAFERHTEAYEKSLERLASGFRINRASDDAAGLTISENLISQITRMRQANRNTQDGISVLQTAEGSLAVIGDNLQRIRELSVQAANDTNGADSRQALSNEIRQLLTDIDRIASASSLNGIQLLGGTTANAFLQIGPNSDPATNTVDLTSVLTSATSLGLGAVGTTGETFATIAAVDLSTGALARSFITDVDDAIEAVNFQRAQMGAFQNKLESVTQNLDLSIENFSNSNSRIRDVDIAAETANLTQAQIRREASASVLGQANSINETVLRLLQNF
ncbi:MAG: flagellin [Cyanobacteria bacterium P01_H01_bin.74]